VGVLSADSLITGNLLTNPGAETGDLTGWTIGGSGTPVVDNGTAELPVVLLPNSGTYDFGGHTGPAGGSPPTVLGDSLSQTVSILVSGITPALVDSGVLSAELSFWEQGLNQGNPSDDASVQLTFLDGSGVPISTVTSPIIDSHNLTWENFSGSYAIPAGTSAITYTMQFWRNQGTYTDAFVDDNLLTIGTPEPATILLMLSGLGFCALFRRSTKPA